MRKRKLLTGMLVPGIVLGLAVTSCGSGAQKATASCSKQTIRLAYIVSASSVFGTGAQTFAKEASAKTEGRVTVKQFAGGQLTNGNQQTEVQQTQLGVIDAEIVSPIILALYVDPRFDIYSLPYLFPDEKTALAVENGPVGKLTGDWLRAKTLEPIGWGVDGFRQITNATRPITKPSDLSGLKIRVAGTKMYKRVFSLLGAKPLTMNFGEVFTALQQHTIDGEENPLSTIETASLYNVQKYVSQWNYSYDPLVFVMNKNKFSQLCSKDQAAVQQAAKDAGQVQLDYTVNGDKQLATKLGQQGMQVTPVDQVDVAAFKDKLVAPIYKEWGPIVGADNLTKMQAAIKTAQTGK